MGDTSAEQCMPCAVCRYWSPTLQYICLWRRRSQKRDLLSSPSMSFLSRPPVGWCLPPKCRERMEIQIFNKLLRMVPGLVDCIVNSDPAEAMDLADLVCSCGLSSYHSLIFENSEGCGERKVWWYQKFKRYSAGLNSPYFRLSPEMSRRLEASITL